MSIVNLNGISVSKASYQRAREIVENKPATGRKSANDVLDFLRKKLPGWNISTSSRDWGEGFRNIEISHGVLRRMAENPEDMIKYKAIILDYKELVPELEEWQQQNPDVALQFGFEFDEEGNTRALAIVKTLLNSGTQTTFELPSNRSSWIDTIREKLDALNEGRVEDANGVRSWAV